MTGSRSDALGPKMSVQFAEFQWLEASRDLTPTPMAETSCPSSSATVITHVVQAENGSGETHGNVQLDQSTRNGIAVVGICAAFPARKRCPQEYEEV